MSTVVTSEAKARVLESFLIPLQDIDVPSIMRELSSNIGRAIASLYGLSNRHHERQNKWGDYTL
jgi:hypothetical protein